MRKVKILISSVAIAGLTGLVTPSAAQADNTAATFAATMNDEYFYAAEHPYGQGKYCRWLGNDGNWADCSSASGPTPGGMQNQASQMYNSGVPATLSAVNVYYNRGYDGAYRCLAASDHWDDLPLGRETFNRWGNNGSGYGLSINDNVASHKWVSSC
jgi:hypothetical protein